MRNESQRTSPHGFLEGRIARHFRQFHNDRPSRDGTASRRTFLLSVAGTAGFALGAQGLARAAQGKRNTAVPKPIPGGVSPLGIFIHHFPVTPTATPLANLTEPSQITDFKGFVGLNRIRGSGR